MEKTHVSSMNDRFFLGVCLATVLILLGFVTMVSYHADPGGIFHHDDEKMMVDIILSGKNVANFENYDERIFEIILIEKYPKFVDTAILGSSRMMQIGSSFFNNNTTVLNNGLSGATIEDDIAIIWKHYERGNLPHNIIIGLDPWILNKNNEQSRWNSIKPEYMRGLELLDIDPDGEDDSPASPVFLFYHKYASLLSRDIVIASLKKLILKYNNPVYPTTRTNSDVAIRLGDGSYSYPEDIRNVSVREVEKKAREYAFSQPIYSLGYYNDIDPDKKNKLVKLIRFLSTNNVNVTIILPPYHPIVYQEISSNPSYAQVMESEKIFQELGRSQGISVLGSYDPSKIKITSGDFFDGMHLNQKGLIKLLEINPTSNNN